LTSTSLEVLRSWLRQDPLPTDQEIAMHAIRQHAFGGPETLEYERVPDLEPGEGQVRIAVEAAGVHLLDTMIRSGTGGGPFPLPDLPMTPGREVAGRVDRVGPGVEPAWEGRRVVAHLGMASGGYATQALAALTSVHEIADALDAPSAVAMIGTGRTAMGILDVAAVTAGDVVLVTAAAGGLGTLLVQAAHRAGAIVAGVAGGDAKVALVRSLGADVAVDYRAGDWPAAVRSQVKARLGALAGVGDAGTGAGAGRAAPAETGVRGGAGQGSATGTPDAGSEAVTVLLDGVGGAVGRAAVDLVRPGGRLVLFGWSSGEPLDLSDDELAARGLTLAPPIGPRIMGEPGALRRFETAALAAAEDGTWTPVVGAAFPLADAAGAHRALEARATTGKVVLVP